MFDLTVYLSAILAFMTYHVVTSVVLGIISYRRAKAAQRILDKYFGQGRLPLFEDQYESILNSHTKKGTDEPPKTH